MINWIKRMFGLQKQEDDQYKMYRDFQQRVKKHNGRIVWKEYPKIGFRIEFDSKEDEQRYYAEKVRKIRDELDRKGINLQDWCE